MSFHSSVLPAWTLLPSCPSLALKNHFLWEGLPFSDRWSFHFFPPGFPGLCFQYAPGHAFYFLSLPGHESLTALLLLPFLFWSEELWSSFGSTPPPHRTPPPTFLLWAGGWDPEMVPVQYLMLIMNLSPGPRLKVTEYPQNDNVKQALLVHPIKRLHKVKPRWNQTHEQKATLPDDSGIIYNKACFWWNESKARVPDSQNCFQVSFLKLLQNNESLVFPCETYLGIEMRVSCIKIYQIY